MSSRHVKLDNKTRKLSIILTRNVLNTLSKHTAFNPDWLPLAFTLAYLRLFTSSTGKGADSRGWYQMLTSFLKRTLLTVLN